MIRLAVIAFLLAVIVLLFKSFFGTRTDEVAPSTEMVQDPNCETYIPKPEAIKKIVGNQEHFFCSMKCFEEYQDKTQDPKDPPKAE